MLMCACVYVVVVGGGGGLLKYLQKVFKKSTSHLVDLEFSLATDEVIPIWERPRG